MQETTVSRVVARCETKCSSVRNKMFQGEKQTGHDKEGF